MNRKKLDQAISQLEQHVECWKQFNQYLALARSKQFTLDDETQFLEIKSVITQELELILAMIETPSPSKEDALALISAAPSIRFLSELSEGSLRNVENAWHKIFISFQSMLGQLKALQRQNEKKGLLAVLFGS
jgi:hypothetical protein